MKSWLLSYRRFIISTSVLLGRLAQNRVCRSDLDIMRIQPPNIYATVWKLGREGYPSSSFQFIISCISITIWRNHCYQLLSLLMKWPNMFAADHGWSLGTRWPALLTSTNHKLPEVLAHPLISP
jgi:hypothetical protein